MIQHLDNLWLRLLSATYRWLMRRVNGHYRREALRRLRRHLAGQKPHLN
jgi:hypothetical protein